MNLEEYKLLKLFSHFNNIEQYIECFLIKYDVRQSYLLEGCKCLGKRKTSLFSRIFYNDNCKIHSSIRKWFPELVETHVLGFGTFISKENIDLSEIKNDDDVGRILGYPAWKGFSNLNRNEIYYSFGIHISFKDFPEQYKNFFEPLDIINNVSSYDISEDMEIIRRKIEYVLKHKTDTFIEINKYIDIISVNKYVHYPIRYLINKLIDNENNIGDMMLDEEKNEIRKYIWNLMNSNDKITQYEFEWNNNIHIGIIISLLLQYENHELKPFYNYFREEHPKAILSSSINQKFALELIKVLDITKRNN